MFISKTEPINKPLKLILYKFKNALYDSDITPLPDEKEFRDVLKRYLKEKLLLTLTQPLPKNLVVHKLKMLKKYFLEW